MSATVLATTTSTSPPLEEHGVDRSTLLAVGLQLYRARLALYSSAGSAVTHLALLLALSLLLSAPSHSRDSTTKITLESSINPPAVRPVRPELLEEVKLRIEPTVRSTVVQRNQTASGLGSSGSGGGRGGGSTGGTNELGMNLGLASLASGGTGSGLDSAFGTHMLGEVGEPIDDSASFFGIKASGKRFVFVVDTSGSMHENDRYLRCRQELWNSISAMKYGQQYLIIFFNNNPHPMPENRLVDAKPDQLSRTAKWLLGIGPGGGTHPWESLKRAFIMKPDAIYLLTDGEFDPAIVAKVDRIQPETKKKIPVHTIAFQSLPGAELLKVISQVSGGQHTYIP
jgi:hypothetical protein